MGVSAAGVDDSLVLETLKTMDEQTIEGSAWMTHQAVATGDDDLLVELATWSKDQTAGLTALRGELPTSTLDELGESLGLLGDIDTRTVALAGALDCASGPPIESTDALGPVPGLCMPDPVTPPVAGGESGQPGSDPSSGTQPAPGTAPSGGTTVPGDQGTGVPGAPGSGDGGGTGVPVPNVPGGEETTGGTPGLPSIPVPTLPTPSLTLPNLPGGQTTTPGSTSSSSPSTTTPPLLPCIPIPPLINC